ncbi:solute carrier family 35 member G1 [Caerostris extrusa]|uniref:Solute carrier family 35 member G1 n=1 Tax=Caerostris extrusa TaxID=172846 RepID=A0AAV4RE93_CAEEX|nr:solute carrier family 35 member G1 [Caerostris extrusa]
MLSATSYSLTTVFVKEMKNLDPGQLSFYRFIAMFAISMPDAIKCGENILGPKDLRLLHLLRSILGTTGNYLSYVAYHYLPLGDAATILATLPVSVTITAWIFLKEPCGIFQSFITVITVLAISITTKLPFF